MRNMTSRERVYAALNFEEPDRVPISFSGTQVSGITECPPDGRVLSKLYEYLGIKDYEPIKTSPVFNIVNNVDERVMRRLHSDMIQLNVNVPPGIEPIDQPDGSKIIPYLFGMRTTKVGYYDDPNIFPMGQMTTEKDIDDYPWWPDPNWDVMEGVVERAKYLHEETDYFVVADTFSAFFPLNGYAYNGGMEKWLTDMKIRPKFYHKLCQKMLEMRFLLNEQFWTGVSPYIDGVQIYDDLGSQVGGLMSLADFREYYKPYQAQIVKKLREWIRPETKIFHHSCGSVYYAIPDLIEVGENVIEALQPLARNMEPARLKAEFGGKIGLMGGFDIQQLMPLGSVEQVVEGAKKLIQEYAPGGGYIFATAHNIEPDTPVENILALFDTVYEYGRYPILGPDGEELKYPLLEPGGQEYVDYIRGLRLEDKLVETGG